MSPSEAEYNAQAVHDERAAVMIEAAHDRQTIRTMLVALMEARLATIVVTASYHRDMHHLGTDFRACHSKVCMQGKRDRVEHIDEFLFVTEEKLDEFVEGSKLLSDEPRLWNRVIEGNTL